MQVVVFAVVCVVASAQCPTGFGSVTMRGQTTGSPALLPPGMAGLGSVVSVLSFADASVASYVAAVGSPTQAVVSVVSVDSLAASATVLGNLTLSDVMSLTGISTASRFTGFGSVVARISAPNSQPVVLAVGFPLGGHDGKGAVAFFRYTDPSTFTYIAMIDSSTSGLGFNAVRAANA